MTTPPTQDSVQLPNVESAIDAYLEDYEMVGEDESGRDACYRPTEGEHALIKDAIFGLLEDDDFKAWMQARAALDAKADDICLECHGTGEVLGLSGGGPDAYDMFYPCKTCGGSGGKNHPGLDARASWLDEIQRIAQMANTAMHQDARDQRNILEDIADGLSAILSDVSGGSHG